MTFAPLEAIFRAEDYVTELYVVERGMVAQRGYIVRPGTIFGDEAFYRNKVWHAPLSRI